MNYEQAETVRRIWNYANDLKRTTLDEPPTGDLVGLSPKEIASYSILKEARRLNDARAHRYPTPEAGLEAECHRVLAEQFGHPMNSATFYVPREVLRYGARTLGTIPGSKGGYLVETSIASFIDMLQNASVCFSSGAQLLTNSTQNVSVTKQLTGANITWLGPPGSSVSAVDPSFGQISASPKTVVSLTEIAEQALYQAGPVAELFLRRQLALSLAAGVDAAMLVGSGGVQPTGIVNTPNINAIAGASFTRTKALDMQKQAVDANAVVTPDAQSYICPPATAALLADRQEYTGVQSTIWSGSIAKGQIVGVPARSTKAMTVGSLLFGDFSQLALIEFGPLAIAVNSSDTNFNKGVFAIRALWMVDVIIVEPKSFTLATSVA